MFIPRAAALILLGFALEAVAQTPAGDLTRCGDANADISISACTPLIATKGQPDDTLAKAYTYRGFSYLKKNRYDPAIEDFTHAIDLDPQNAWAYNNRGNAYFNKRQFDLALRDYDQALLLNETGYATLFYGRGAILSSKGETARAIAQFDLAIRLQPDFPEAFKNRGNAYFDNGQFSKAIDDYDQALQSRPDYPSALQSRGDAYAAKGQYDRAIEDYSKVIGLQPGPAAALRSRGNAYKAKGEFDKAITDLTAAIAARAFPGVLDDRGDAYLELGQKARAMEDYNEAVRLQPKDSDAWHSKGRGGFYSGQWEDAAADFQKSLAADPSNPYAMIWLHLANARAGKNDAVNLEQQASKVQRDEWPAAVVNLFLGKLKPAFAIAFASDADPDKKKTQQCEAEFYVGEYMLTQQDTSGALTHLHEAQRICSGVVAEALAARMEIKRLEDAPKK